MTRRTRRRLFEADAKGGGRSCPDLHKRRERPCRFVQVEASTAGAQHDLDERR
jgi:hypothetical protein